MSLSLEQKKELETLSTHQDVIRLKSVGCLDSESYVELLRTGGDAYVSMDIPAVNRWFQLLAWEKTPGRPHNETETVSSVAENYSIRMNMAERKFFDKSCDHILKSPVWERISESYLDGATLKTKKDVILAVLRLIPAMKELKNKHYKDKKE